LIKEIYAKEMTTLILSVKKFLTVLDRGAQTFRQAGHTEKYKEL
jgi:hypothetical protein